MTRIDSIPNPRAPDDPRHHDGFPADARPRARSRGAALRRLRDRLAPARQVAAPLHLSRFPPPHARARRRAPAPRAQERRPRRDAHVEPLRAPRSVSRGAVRRRRCCTRSTCGSTRTTSLTSRTTRGDRFLIVDDVLLPLYEKFRDADVVRARDRRAAHGSSRARGRRLRGADRRSATPFTPPALDENDAGGDVLHVGHDRPAQRRRLQPSLDRAAHARDRPPSITSA